MSSPTEIPPAVLQSETISLMPALTLYDKPSFWTFTQLKAAEVQVDPTKVTPETPDFLIIHQTLVEMWNALTDEEKKLYPISPHLDLSLVQDNTLPMNELKKAAFSTLSASDIVTNVKNIQPKKRKMKSGKSDTLLSMGEITSSDLSLTSPPYLLFCFEKRKEIKLMYPQSSIPEQSHLLEQMWTSLDYVNKQEYVFKSRKNLNSSASGSGSGNAIPGSSQCSLNAKAATFVKKANMTAYITFCTLRRTEVKQLYSSIGSFSAMGKLLGWLWAVLTDAEKQYYDNAAAKLNAETLKRNELIQQQLQLLYQEQQQQLQEQYLKSHVKMTSMYPTSIVSSFNFPANNNNPNFNNNCNNNMNHNNRNNNNNTNYQNLNTSNHNGSNNNHMNDNHNNTNGNGIYMNIHPNQTSQQQLRHANGGGNSNTGMISPHKLNPHQQQQLSNFNMQQQQQYNSHHQQQQQHMQQHHHSQHHPQYYTHNNNNQSNQSMSHNPYDMNGNINNNNNNALGGINNVNNTSANQNYQQQQLQQRRMMAGGSGHSGGGNMNNSNTGSEGMKKKRKTTPPSNPIAQIDEGVLTINNGIYQPHLDHQPHGMYAGSHYLGMGAGSGGGSSINIIGGDINMTHASSDYGMSSMYGQMPAQTSQQHAGVNNGNTSSSSSSSMSQQHQLHQQQQQQLGTTVNQPGVTSSEITGNGSSSSSSSSSLLVNNNLLTSMPSNKRQPPSAYITFCTMKRTEVRTIFPDAAFGDLGKILGMLWGAMSEESRAEYLQIAQSVEENQKKLNLNSNLLGIHQQQQLQIQQQNDWSLRCKLPTAFALFCEEIRPLLIERCPPHDPVETIKIFTAEWGFLNHLKKEEFIQRAATNEAISLAKFHQANSHVKKQVVPSAYVVFSAEKRKELLRENPSLNFQEIGRACGQLWRDLNADQKTKWSDHALALTAAAAATTAPAANDTHQQLLLQQPPPQPSSQSPQSSLPPVPQPQQQSPPASQAQQVAQVQASQAQQTLPTQAQVQHASQAQAQVQQTSQPQAQVQQASQPQAQVQQASQAHPV